MLHKQIKFDINHIMQELKWKSLELLNDKYNYYKEKAQHDTAEVYKDTYYIIDKFFNFKPAEVDYSPSTLKDIINLISNEISRCKDYGEKHEELTYTIILNIIKYIRGSILMQFE